MTDAIDINLHIGRRLREKRRKAGLTLSKIGDALRVTYQQVQKYESGQSRVPIARLYEFSNLYRVPIQYFFEDLGMAAMTNESPVGEEDVFITAATGKRSLHVLLIEADPVDEFLTRKTLSAIDDNISIFCVHNEAQTLDFLRQRMRTTGFSTPDLIFMDIKLSKRNAYSLLSAIKKDAAFQQIPVIILTNSINREDLVQTYRHGASSFIAKTPDLEAFERNLRVCLDYWGQVVVLPSAGQNTG